MLQSEGSRWAQRVIGRGLVQCRGPGLGRLMPSLTSPWLAAPLSDERHALVAANGAGVAQPLRLTLRQKMATIPRRTVMERAADTTVRRSSCLAPTPMPRVQQPSCPARQQVPLSLVLALRTPMAQQGRLHIGAKLVRSLAIGLDHLPCPVRPTTPATLFTAIDAKTRCFQAQHQSLRRACPDHSNLDHSVALTLSFISIHKRLFFPLHCHLQFVLQVSPIIERTLHYLGDANSI